MSTSNTSTVSPEFTCLVADDNQAILDAVSSVLREADIEVIGMGSSGVEALHLLEQRPATAIVLDVRMHDLSGLDVARLAAEVAPETAVIFHTSHADSSLVREALDAGVRAVVLKDGSSANLLQAISAVAADSTYIDPRLSPDPRLSAS